MPYIDRKRRKELEEPKGEPNTAGELNYLFTVLAIDYVRHKGESYQTYNDIIGALECCKHELYRRKILAYEEAAIDRNGDVYYE